MFFFLIGTGTLKKREFPIVQYRKKINVREINFRALCDIKQVGKLNDEQFALAMWLIAKCLKGIEPPVTLTPDMVPPSFRNIKPIDGLVVSFAFNLWNSIFF